MAARMPPVGCNPGAWRRSARVSQIRSGTMNKPSSIRRGREVPSFDVFMKQRDAIATDYVNGEPESLAEIVTRQDPATFFSPGGDHQSGAHTVAKRYAKDAQAFGKGSTSHLEVL